MVYYNWTPHNIFNWRNKYVKSKDSKLTLLKLDEKGWAIGDLKGLDIWTACRILNDSESNVSDICINCEYFNKCGYDLQKPDYCPGRI